MPGILPMKVIKVGTSSQSRIAQACDRCRSKKIRCDGIRPCCTQCANVGFECRTSDKLSRRAFPRGYTESLEERVRQLETEIRELKDLLDEKDEKIDMLSKMHDNRPTPAASHASPVSVDSRRRDSRSPAKEEVFRIQASPLLLGVENSDSYFMGASSGRSFIEAFKRKIQEIGKPCSDFNPEAFLHIQGCYPLVSEPPARPVRAPPRLFTDRCINIYFQEWAPLFPVLHKPTFLRLYEDFVADPEKVKNDHKIAQLCLVYSIAALSSESTEVDQIAACEVQWQRALDAVIMNNTMATLQCLVLAMMYCMIRADYKRLQHYKGVAIGLSHRLGLHQSQKRFSFGALTIETRKKVFWTLYTLDCFSASMLGLPKLLKEEDVHAEYPSDTDDEYVTEKGFQPTLPGEYTRLSSALALFRLSRILAQVLEKVYPAASTHELSLQLLSSLDAELSDWSENLPNHLKLNFVQDKPSTDVTGSRSPILALAYYYTRTLIHRPAVTSSLGSKAAPSLIAVGECSKHIVQIVQLLEERSMTFSFCLNKTDMLVLCGVALLYQSLGLSPDSKLMREVERLFAALVDILDRVQGPGTYDLKRVASILISVDQHHYQNQNQSQTQQQQQQHRPYASPARSSPDTSMGAPPPRASPPMQHAAARRRSIYSLGPASATSAGGPAPPNMSESDLLSQQEKLRRMTMPSIPGAARPAEPPRSQSRASLDHVEQPTSAARRDHNHRFSISQIQQSMMRRVRTNLDYLSFGGNGNGNGNSNGHGNNSNNSQQPHAQSASPVQNRNAAPPMAQPNQAYPPTKPLGGESGNNGVSIAEWEAILGAMDSGQMYDAIYGGPSFGTSMPAAEASPPSMNGSGNNGNNGNNYGNGGGGGGGGGDWSSSSPDAWDLSGFSVADLVGGVGAGAAAGGAPGHPMTQSVPSISDESLSSGDDLAGSDLYLSMGSDDFHGNGGGGGGGGAGGPSMVAAQRSSLDGHLPPHALDLNLGI